MADLMRIAYDTAENPGVAGKIVRRAKIEAHNNLKRSAIGRQAINKTIGRLCGAVSFIPLAGPLLATPAEAASGPLANLVEGKVFKRIYTGKLAKYQGNDYKMAKFQIKDFDLQELDRYRRKLNDSIRDLNTAWEQNADAMNSGACEGAINIGSQYFYAQRRLRKLGARIVKLAEITDHLAKWTAEVQAELDKAAPEIEGVFEMAGRLPAECHVDCSTSHCALPQHRRR